MTPADIADYLKKLESPFTRSALATTATPSSLSLEGELVKSLSGCLGRSTLALISAYAQPLEQSPSSSLLTPRSVPLTRTKETGGEDLGRRAEGKGVKEDSVYYEDICPSTRNRHNSILLQRLTAEAMLLPMDYKYPFVLRTIGEMMKYEDDELLVETFPLAPQSARSDVQHS